MSVTLFKTRPMDDAANPANIPAGAQIVGGYPMGEYAWTRADWARFPKAIKVLIAVFFDEDGLWKLCNVADVESGALTPAQAREFIEARQAMGKKGNTVYCSLATLGAVLEACEGLDYWLWIADWAPGTPCDMDRAAAVQYAGNVRPGYDETEVFSAEWLREIDEANRPWPLAA